MKESPFCVSCKIFVRDYTLITFLLFGKICVFHTEPGLSFFMPCPSHRLPRRGQRCQSKSEPFYEMECLGPGPTHVISSPSVAVGSRPSGFPPQRRPVVMLSSLFTHRRFHDCLGQNTRPKEADEFTRLGGAFSPSNRLRESPFSECIRPKSAKSRKPSNEARKSAITSPSLPPSPSRTSDSGVQMQRASERWVGALVF